MIPINPCGLERDQEFSLSERLNLLRSPFEYEAKNVDNILEHSCEFEWPSYKKWFLPHQRNVAIVHLEDVSLNFKETLSCVYEVRVRDYSGEIDAHAITPIPGRIHTIINNRRLYGVEYNPKIDQPLIDEWIDIWDGRVGQGHSLYPLLDRIDGVQYYPPSKETQILIAHSEGADMFGTYDVELLFDIANNSYHLIDAEPCDDQDSYETPPVTPIEQVYA